MSTSGQQGSERATQRDVGVNRLREPTKAVVLTPDISQPPREEGTPLRTASERLLEAEGLAVAIDLDVVHSAIVSLSGIRPATLIGSGKVEELAQTVRHHKAELVIIDHSLSPVQQQNLEKAWNAKVLDRTGLILEIFGRRARTKEGTLQVELAHLNYQRGRLVRSWTHLERQRGGAGFLGGPGETQIEADRRMLRDKIKRLERELAQVRRTRTLHRSKRKKVPLPVVALVGYTNAGKSTLFNKLTGADVEAQDMLFATLDPTLRRVRLPGGTWIILSDTVGFISDLPTHLIAAFRATLEEVKEADLILHVHDISDDQAAAQSHDVNAILQSMEIETDDGEHLISVWNKIDALSPERREAVIARFDGDNEVAVSALTGARIDQLLALIQSKIAGSLLARTIRVKSEDYAQIAWLHENALVQKRTDHKNGDVTVKALMTPHTDAALRRQFPPAEET